MTIEQALAQKLIEDATVDSLVGRYTPGSTEGAIYLEEIPEGESNWPNICIYPLTPDFGPWREDTIQVSLRAKDTASKMAIEQLRELSDAVINAIILEAWNIGGFSVRFADVQTANYIREPGEVSHIPLTVKAVYKKQ